MNEPHFLPRRRILAGGCVAALALILSGAVSAPAQEAAATPAAAPALTAPAASPPAPATGAGVVPDLVSAPPAPVPAPAAKPAGNPLFDWRFMRDKGGPLIYVLAGMSVIGLAMVVYAFITLSRRRVVPGEFVKDLVMMLTYHRYPEARKACEKNGSPVAAIALAGLDYVERVEEPDPEMLKEVLQGEGSRQNSMMATQISFLMDLGVIAPMVGLLGTVTGMVQAFSGLSLHISGFDGTPMQLIDGLMNAMITTVVGLVVGIPAMVFYSYFRARSIRLTGNLEMVATELLTVMAKRPRT